MLKFQLIIICLLFLSPLSTHSLTPVSRVKSDTSRVPFNLELRQKLFHLIGFEIFQNNNNNFKNGYLQIISQNYYQNLIPHFVSLTTKEFQLPILIHNNFTSLAESKIKKLNQNSKSISVPHWMTHRAATIVFLDKSSTSIIDEVSHVGGATRRGDIVFVGQESVLLPLFDNLGIKSLKYKSGIVIDTKQLLVVTQPLVYTGKMIITPRIPPRFNMKVNVQGRHIRISGSKMPPYCDVRIGKNGEKIFSGSNYAIIKSASVKYNFTFDLDAPPKKSPGTKLKNGTWIGMLADVVAGKADITIVNAYNIERYHVIDFTTSFTVTNLVYATSHAKREVSLAAIIYPYDTFVWTLIVTLFIFVIPVFGLSFWFNPYGFNRDWKDVLYKSIFIPVALCLRQTFHVPHGLNFLTLMWMIFIIIIDIGYESNLVSYLSFPEPGVIPTNFVELANHPEYQVHFNIFSNIGRSLFRKGQSDMLKKLNLKFVTESGTVDCLIGAFATDHGACVGWDDILNSGIGKNLTLTFGIDPLFMSQHSLVNNWLAFGLKKDSEYTEAFSYIASSYADAGLVTRWKQEIISFYRNIGRGWLSTQVNSSLYTKLTHLALGNADDPKPFKIVNVLISFVVFLTGIFISSLVFSIEIFPHFFKIIKSYNSHTVKWTKSKFSQKNNLGFPTSSQVERSRAKRKKKFGYTITLNDLH